MIIKEKPEDFVVKEIPEFDTDNLSKKKDTYIVYELTKKQSDLFSVLKEVAKVNRIPYKEITFAGIKDKYGITTQYISVPSKYTINTVTKQDREQGKVIDEAYSIVFKGFVSEAIARGGLKGNTFTITIRDIQEAKKEEVLTQIKNLTKPIPNYFDSQRMGSYTKDGFLGKFLVKKDYEGFVKAYLTNTTKYMDTEEKKRRMTLKTIWNEPEKRDAFNREIFNEETWIERAYEIDAHTKEMAVAGYQSYLFNEVLKELIKKQTSEVKKIQYAAGELLFPNDSVNLPEEIEGVNPKLQDTTLYKNILAKEGVSIEEFDITDFGNYFSPIIRQTTFTVNNITHKEFEKDELHKGNFKITVSFDLPKGSYATIVLKKIMGE